MSIYAKHISCPALLLWGEKDEKVSRKEIDEIYRNLDGIRRLETYPSAGHENYLNKYKAKWTMDLSAFLDPRGKKSERQR
jgi:pimeloyl-ACP methyl ester carboxylesterase